MSNFGDTGGFKRRGSGSDSTPTSPKSGNVVGFNDRVERLMDYDKKTANRISIHAYEMVVKSGSNPEMRKDLYDVEANLGDGVQFPVATEKNGLIYVVKEGYRMTNSSAKPDARSPSNGGPPGSPTYGNSTAGSPSADQSSTGNVAANSGSPTQGAADSSDQYVELVPEFSWKDALNAKVLKYIALWVVTVVVNIVFVVRLVENNPSTNNKRWFVDIACVVVYLISITIWTYAQVVEGTVINKTLARPTDDAKVTYAICTVGAGLLMFPWTLFTPSADYQLTEGEGSVQLKIPIIIVNTAFLVLMMKRSYTAVRTFKRFLDRTLSTAKDEIVISEKGSNFAVYSYADALNYKYDIASIVQYMKFLTACRKYLFGTFVFLFFIFLFCVGFIAVLVATYSFMGVLEISYTTTLMAQFLLKLYQIDVWNDSVERFENDRGISLHLKVNIMGVQIKRELYLAYLLYGLTYIGKIVVGSKSSED